MEPNAYLAAKACHQLLHNFLKSSSENNLYSFSSNFNNDNNNPAIVDYHARLNLPSIFPPSFNEELHNSTQLQVLNSYNNFLKVLNHWNLNQLSISYNGGKDCLVQLIIYLAALYQHIIIDKRSHENIIHVNAVYVHTENEFKELVKFLEKTVLQYGLDFTAVYTKINSHELTDYQILDESNTNNTVQGSLGRIKCLFSTTPTLQSGFSTYLNSQKLVEAIIVGIRRTDPYGLTLKLEQRTDTHRGWPDFVRINPILDWHTSEVWYFIKWLQRESLNSEFEISYCPLYDEGYTSLGGCDDTVKNPQLKRKDHNDLNVKFWPAWWIPDDDIERLSRGQKGKV